MRLKSEEANKLTDKLSKESKNHSIVPEFSKMSVYPNPFLRSLTIELDWPRSEYVQISLVTATGRIAFKERLLCIAGHQSLTLDIPTSVLTKGSHFLSIENALGEKLTTQLASVSE